MNKKDEAIDCLNYLFNLKVLDEDDYNNIECQIMNLEDDDE